MSKVMNTKFRRAVTSLFKLVFPDTHEGKKGGTSRECDIEGTPFFIDTNWVEEWKDLEDIIACSERALPEDKRPRVVVVKKRGRREPHVGMKLTDFLSFLEKHLWRPE